MIKVKKINAGGLYLFRGKASANSLFIESLAEAKQFIIRANFYFKGYLKIHEYLLTKDGWIMIVRIASEKDIFQKSIIKDGEGELERFVWKIISERMRIFLSVFVKYTNLRQGRTGSKVHSSYERYVFRSLNEAKAYINRIRKGLIKLGQRRKKYRGNKKHYMVPAKIGRGSIFMSSRKLKKRLRKCEEKLECLQVLRLKSLVPLQNELFGTQNHFFSNSG